MQNILAAVFEVESEGYQAITTLRNAPLTEKSAILEMALVKKEGESIHICDSFSSGAQTTDDTARGGVIGGLIGILGGPIGVLLGGSAGALTGSIIDAKDADDTVSVMETIASKLYDGTVALIVLAEEDVEEDLDSRLSPFKTEILRFDAAVIAEEVEEAEKLQKEMARQARIQLRAAKKEDRKKAVEEKRAKIAADFAVLKEKFNK